MAANILSFNNVSKSYADKVALKGVTFDIPSNSIFGLLGPNGAGKTSLIRIVNQITAADSGKILFGKEPINRDVISKIGYLPEERGMYKKMRVEEQLLYLAQLKGLKRSDAKEKIHHWFEKFEIENWRRKRIDELSKGMQQKVQFILTVLHEPELLILDEPFTGFDPINTELIKSEILELKKKGVSIIFSTHNMASVEEICDEIALIDKSRVVLNGSVKDIREQYKNNVYEISFQGNMVTFANTLWTGAQIIETVKDEDDEHMAIVKIQLNKGFLINDILKALVQKVQIFSLQEVLPSLNEIFIQTVSKSSEPDQNLAPKE
ncbi:MAG: ATP-binding cassette domain-containing protein [Flavobacteriales bacterium]|nr:ATP-binding cassette domain-containing protein [Flavobacteriales bacterium]